MTLKKAVVFSLKYFSLINISIQRMIFLESSWSKVGLQDCHTAGHSLARVVFLHDLRLWFFGRTGDDKTCLPALLSGGAGGSQVRGDTTGWFRSLRLNCKATV